MTTIETTTKRYTGNIGWNGTKRHIIRVDEDNEGNFRGRNQAVCADEFSWSGAKQPTQIKKEEPTTDNVSCKKCLIILERIQKAAS